MLVRVHAFGLKRVKVTPVERKVSRNLEARFGF